jgi:hypothetical protein
MLKIFIGYDLEKEDCYNVCRFSLLKRTDDVEIIRIGNSILSNDIWYRKKNNLETTEFSICRFLTPFLSEYKGISIFMDDDFLWRCDIKSILDYFDSSKAVMVCQHDYVPKYTTKWLNNKQTVYEKKNWSSLMMFNNEHPDCLKLSVENVNEQTGLWLHQFKWTDNVGAIPLSYNFLVGEYKEYKNINAFHFTNGCPIFDDCKTQDFAEEWLNDYSSYKSSLSK